MKIKYLRISFSLMTAMVLVLGIQPQVFADSVSGSLTINEESIQSGDKIKIYLQSPADAPFIQQVRIFKDPKPEDVIAGNWPLVNRIGSIPISFEQGSVSIGMPFEVTVDTLNYSPGKYYFTIFATKAGSVDVFDSVDILATDQTAPFLIRQDVLNADMAFALYSKEGQFLSNLLMPNSQTLANDSVYILAINLSKFSLVKNGIDVDFYNNQGTTLQKAQLMQIKVDRKKNLWDTLSIDSRCASQNVDMSAYPNGIAVIHFRTPGHYKYYEYDGQLHFKLNAVGTSAGTCDVTASKIIVGYNDLPAAPAITVRDQAAGSLATFNVKLIRIGYNRLMTQDELAQAAGTLTAEFQEATKNYFKINVVGYEIYPLVNDVNRAKVISWYTGLSKTPGKPVFDLNNPDELYLATLMYYSLRPTESIDLMYDINRIRPLPVQTDDYYASYWVDGLEGLGKGAGAVGSYVSVASIYLTPNVFFTTTEGQTTYHYDISACSYCGGTTQGYLDSIGERRHPLVAVINTSLHEFGHGLWVRSINVSTGDNQTQKYPFYSDFVVQDDSGGYFTRMEYMSYGRNRSALDQTYGDEYLEQLIGPLLSCPASTLDVGSGLMGTFPPANHGQTSSLNCFALDNRYQGVAYASCEFGSWTNVVPGCTLSNCPDTSLDIGSGLIGMFPASPSGTTRTISCPGGYVGTPARTCDLGTWGALTNGCTPLSCGATPVFPNATVNSGGSNHGDTRTVSCNPGYTGTSTAIACQFGNWTGSGPSCVLNSPDLVMTAVSGPSTAVTGTSITIANTVQNQGTAPAGSFYVGLYVSADATITKADTWVATRYMSGLSGGIVSGANTGVTLPTNLAPGTYYIGAIADYANAVKESNETNNARTGNAITLTSGVDLIMTAVSGPSSATRGTSVTISNTIKNQGVGKATNSSSVGLYLSKDSVITTADTRVGTRTISSLASGTTSTASTTVTIPSTLTVGSYYIGAIGDYTNTVKENNESNNARAGNTIVVR